MTVSKVSLPLRLAFLVFCLLTLPFGAAQGGEADRAGGYISLEGLDTFRGIIDLSHGEPGTVLRYLQLIAQMDDDLKAMGMPRHIVIGMRGGSVRYLRSERDKIPHADQIVAEEIARAVAELDARNIRIEACKVAMDRFEVPVDGVLDPVNVVENTFITLIGFQQQGYGLVAIP